MAAWEPVGATTLSLKNLSAPLSSALPTSLNVALPESSYNAPLVGVANYGWWGIPVKVQPYTGSFYVKGDYVGSFTVSLQSYLTNQTFGHVEVESEATSEEWVQHSFTLTPTTDAPNINNTFAVTFDPAVRTLSHPEHVGALIIAQESWEDMH